MDDALFGFTLWTRSIGLTPFERSTAANEVFGNGHTVETEELVPRFDSPKRNTTLLRSIAHFCGSTLGGGLLLVPRLFARTGIRTAGLIIVLAILQERCLYLLCLTARRAGVATFPQLARVAFGAWAEHTMSVVLFLFSYLVGIGYMMEMAELWAPFANAWNVAPPLGLLLALFGSLLVTSPMYAIRDFRCYYVSCLVSVGVIVILIASVGWENLQQLKQVLQKQFPVELLQLPNPDDPVIQNICDWLTALPIISMSLFSFNILKLQNQLKCPTKDRVGQVIRWGKLGNSFWIIVFGGLTSTANNLLSYNLVSRVFCFGWLIMSLASVMPTLRVSFLEMIDFMIIKGTSDNQCQKIKEICPEDCCDEDDDEETCISFPSMSTWSTEKTHTDVFVQVNEETRLLAPIDEGIEPPACNIFSNPFAHYASTLFLILFGYGIAIGLTLAEITVWQLWSLTGCVFSFLVCFALPCIFFLEIQTRQPIYPGTMVWRAFCWFIIVLSVLATLLCTVASVVQNTI